MPEEEKQSDTPAPAPAPAIVSILKDTKSVRTQEFLLLHDLDDIAGSRDAYLQARTEWLEYYAMLRILDPLIDYAAARNGVPWAADDPVVLDIHDGVGGKSGIARVVTGEVRETMRLRAEHVLKAFIPTGVFWKQDLIKFSKSRPILGFIKDLDSIYLSVDRADFLNSQAAFFGFRWNIDTPMRAFNREFNRLGDEYDATSLILLLLTWKLILYGSSMRLRSPRSTTPILRPVCHFSRQILSRPMRNVTLLRRKTRI